MKFGDAKLLAIEFELAPDYCGEWLYGDICYWVGGEKLGNNLYATSLRPILFELEYMRWARGKRQNERFSEMPALELANLLSGVMYGVPQPIGSTLEERTQWESVSEEEGWARHLILPTDVSFGDWIVYCVQNERCDRVIWSKDPYSAPREIKLNPGEVDSVLEQTTQALSALYELEVAARDDG